MRDRYFGMYQCIKYKECFYGAHGENAKKWYDAYTAVTIAISIFSVLVWSISKNTPTLWAIIIAVAQFAQALSVKLIWAEQLTALRYLMPELAKLLLDIDRDWLRIDVAGYEDKKILELVSTYERRYSDLEKQFTNGISFHRKTFILSKAEDNQRKYFYARYPDTKKQERNEVINAV